MNDAFGHPQSVLVLGGTSEIARSILDALIERGARRVILAGRDPAGLQRAAADIRRGGLVDVETVPFEAGDLSSHAAAVDQAFSGGDIDLVLVAFGVLGDQRADERDSRRAVAVVETNFTAAVSTGVEVAGRMRRQGHGTIVVLSSVAGERARRSNFIYGAAKAGADAFYQGLAAAEAEHAVRVLVVRPGFVKTRMTEGMKPAPFATTPEAVAAVVVRAIERGGSVSGTVWAPPVLRWVMTVLRHLPTPIFRRLPI